MKSPILASLLIIPSAALIAVYVAAISEVHVLSAGPFYLPIALSVAATSGGLFITLTAWWLWMEEQPPSLLIETEMFGLHVARHLLGMGGIVLTVLSSSALHGNTSLATVLNATKVAWVVLFEWVLKHLDDGPLPHRRELAVKCAAVGMLIAGAWGASSSGAHAAAAVVGIVLGLASGACDAGLTMVSNALCTRCAEPVVRIVWNYSGIASAAAWGIVLGHVPLGSIPAELRHNAVALFIAYAAIVVGMLLEQFAEGHGVPSLVSFLSMVRLPAAGIINGVRKGLWPTAGEWSGMALIAAAVALVAWAEDWARRRLERIRRCAQR